MPKCKNITGVAAVPAATVQVKTMFASTTIASRKIRYPPVGYPANSRRHRRPMSNPLVCCGAGTGLTVLIGFLLARQCARRD
jgi:hypothetical protein